MQSALPQRTVYRTINAIVCNESGAWIDEWKRREAIKHERKGVIMDVLITPNKEKRKREKKKTIEKPHPRRELRRWISHGWEAALGCSGACTLPAVSNQYAYLCKCISNVPRTVSTPPSYAPPVTPFQCPRGSRTLRRKIARRIISGLFYLLKNVSFFLENNFTKCYSRAKKFSGCHVIITSCII